MKRPCALISLTLIFALMLSLSATAHANESISDYDSPKASRENSYRIDFQNDILFNSPTMRSNLSTISESLDEVIVCLVAVHGAFLRMNTKPSAVLASHQI